MLEMRGQHGSDSVFHGLVPAILKMAITEFLIIPDELFPLTIEGEKDTLSGEEYFWVNSAHIRQGVLINVANLRQLEVRKQRQ